eukprot:TRINITY_DN7478_c0_g1_i3.p1 TRINITY_DN7478_c0_g1~~TRINITY_DN7478_c0_g1_i3.p1  ORF type:complete len:183 (-),score=16.85 TRINITY_DN7478_c0_g1_i3:129-677(-)
MKEQNLYSMMVYCVTIILNLYVFLYCGGYFVFYVFDATIDSQITDLTCNTDNATHILCQNGSNATDGIDYCENFTIATVMNLMFLGGGTVCFMMWLFVNAVFIMYVVKSNKTINQMSLENDSLQTKLIDRNLEIADLKRQLNGRNDRRRNREDSSLPPYTEQENERGRILTINRLPDYQAVQ